MSVMFGISHIIGLCPMLANYALSGLPSLSPERAKYDSEAVTPLAIKIIALLTKQKQEQIQGFHL